MWEFIFGFVAAKLLSGGGSNSIEEKISKLTPEQKAELKAELRRISPSGSISPTGSTEPTHY